MIVEQLYKLGPQGGVFEFGYNILSENLTPDNSDDIHIFIGNLASALIL